jgi:hypothetical protein
VAFLLSLQHYGVNVIDLSDEDLQSDFSNA